MHVKEFVEKFTAIVSLFDDKQMLLCKDHPILGPYACMYLNIENRKNHYVFMTDIIMWAIDKEYDDFKWWNKKMDVKDVYMTYARHYNLPLVFLQYDKNKTNSPTSFPINFDRTLMEIASLYLYYNEPEDQYMVLKNRFDYHLELD